MKSRGYSITFIAGAVLFFVLTLGANVVLDPEAVFGTTMFPRKLNANERVFKLRKYEAVAAATDAVLFSSSRGNLLRPRLLVQGMQASHFLSASMSYGMISDHLPLLKFILHDKASRPVKLKHVFLLLDTDFFGRQPWTDHNINSFLPPDLSGESAGRYWWRYLTAFQYRLWRDVIRANGASGAAMAGGSLPLDSQDAGDNGDGQAFARQPDVEVSEDYRLAWNRLRPDLKQQLRQLQEFVALCRANNVELTVVASPQRRIALHLNDPEEISRITGLIGQITPIWDFNSPPLIADEGEYWLDNSHFDKNAGDIMLDRIFARAVPPAFAEWGQLRGD
jgi:hypothetical protein